MLLSLSVLLQNWVKWEPRLKWSQGVLKVLGYKDWVSLGDKDQRHGCHQCTGQNTSPEHKGTVLVSTDRKALGTELGLWNIHCYSSRGKRKRRGSHEKRITLHAMEGKRDDYRWSIIIYKCFRFLWNYVILCSLMGEQKKMGPDESLKWANCVQLKRSSFSSWYEQKDWVCLIKEKSVGKIWAYFYFCSGGSKFTQELKAKASVL